VSEVTNSQGGNHYDVKINADMKNKIKNTADADIILQKLGKQLSERLSSSAQDIHL